jgi:hypothetical protein
VRARDRPRRPQIIETVSEGQVHDPMFSSTATVLGLSESGKGKRKKLAEAGACDLLFQAIRAAQVTTGPKPWPWIR